MPKVSKNINLDPNLKKSAQELFYDLGLDLTTAVTLFLKQSVRQQRIPFEIKRNKPNAETIAAMNEFHEMKNILKIIKNIQAAKKLWTRY